MNHIKMFLSKIIVVTFMYAAMPVHTAQACSGVDAISYNGSFAAIMDIATRFRLVGTRFSTPVSAGAGSSSSSSSMRPIVAAHLPVPAVDVEVDNDVMVMPNLLESDDDVIVMPDLLGYPEVSHDAAHATASTAGAGVTSSSSSGMGSLFTTTHQGHEAASDNSRMNARMNRLELFRLTEPENIAEFEQWLATKKPDKERAGIPSVLSSSEIARAIRMQMISHLFRD